jgi:predicted DCC family thiol-disulfide oxidoreductase YuxK
VEAAEDKEEDSVLLLAPDGRLHARSAAALHIGASLGLPWSLLSGLGLAVHGNVPGAAFALDAAYDYVGRRRLAWFGSKETCRIPTPAERQRFL